MVQGLWKAPYQGTDHITMRMGTGMGTDMGTTKNEAWESQNIIRLRGRKCIQSSLT